MTQIILSIHMESRITVNDDGIGEFCFTSGSVDKYVVMMGMWALHTNQ